MTVPYVLYCYHVYGSILSIRILIVYSFVLYLLTAYFLVILPLPSVESVEAMSGPYYSLRPLMFIKDIVKEYEESGGALYLNRALLQVAFNILMTIPFGIYLRYYFRFSFKKVFILSFLLSLFFELTQLSGLYFYYPRPYRLFDTDDLIANTFGGIVGYVLSIPLCYFLPSREKIDIKARELSTKVSLLRLSVAFGIDVVLVSGVFVYWFADKLFYLLLAYFLFCPLILRGRTLGMAFVHLVLRNKEDRNSGLLFSLNVLLSYLLYFRIPLFVVKYTNILCKEVLVMDERYRFIAYSVVGVLLMGFYIIESVLLVMGKGLVANRITKTKVVSVLL